MSDSAAPTTSTPSTVRLPVASIPAVVLPGAVVTLTLGSQELRSAVTAARRTSDARVLLHTGSGEIAVVAQVPDVGSLPSGDPAAVVRIEGRARIGALHQSERGPTYADAELITDPRPTPRVEALGRELRGVLGVIAELRRSRRLPELLRVAEPSGCPRRRCRHVGRARRRTPGRRARRRRRRRAGPSSFSTGRATTSPSCRWPSRSATTSPKASTSSSASTCCASSWRRSARSSARATATSSPSTARSWPSCSRRRPPTTRSPRRSTGSSAPARSPRSTAGSARGSTVSSNCRGTPAATTTSTSTNVRAVLDADHYGLDDVKARIVEFMAVRKLRTDRGAGRRRRRRHASAAPPRRDHHPRRAARRRQDEPRRVGGPGDGPQVRPCRPRRHP